MSLRPAFASSARPVRVTLGLGVLLMALVLLLGARAAFYQSYATGYGRAETALRLTVNALEADLARYEVVPQLVAGLDRVQRLAAHPDNRALRTATNVWLLDQNEAVQASDIYVIRPDGETIAASNYRMGALSFVGQNFSYRPYFTEAISGNAGRFFGIGTTSGVRGYYFSAPVRDGLGRINGVVAVKVGVERIEESWRGGEYRFLVTDPEGRVFLSSEPGWLYSSLGPPTEEWLARTLSIRRYADAELGELPLERRSAFGLPVFRVAEGGGHRDYLAASQAMHEEGWTVHALLDTASLRSDAWLIVLTLVLLLSAASLGGLFLIQRRAQAAERAAMQRYATAELERRVDARTADLARVNDQLGQEIAERRATEAELRAAQASLVQVGKLAALGQMSASLSHEINQPLAAARNYADSAAILIERGDLTRARDNIAQILALVDRMASIGTHLRNAARAPGEPPGAAQLPAILPETRTIVAQRLATSGAALETDVPSDLPPVRAGTTRLQQVLVNLITNAADAAEGAADPRITLSARHEGGMIVLRVRDRGEGVPDAIAERIFDPFFTTKGVGAGLGLGLSISANIVRDYGGTITCRNADPGAEFCVTLPAAPSTELSAETAA